MKDSGRIDLMSTLVSRNITLQDRRTSMRLEPAMWDALDEICRREGRTIHELCTMVDRQRRESKLTAAIRVFVMAYYRAMQLKDVNVLLGLLKTYDIDAVVLTPATPAVSFMDHAPGWQRIYADDNAVVHIRAAK